MEFLGLRSERKAGAKKCQTSAFKVSLQKRTKNKSKEVYLV